MANNLGEGTGALEKALDVLDAVGAVPEGLGQSDLASRLSLPRTTVYRLLATLVARGLLRRDPLRKVYCLGLRCFELARQAYPMSDLAAAAAAELRQLRDITGETTYLAVLDGRDVLSLERCDGAHSHRSAAALGERKPVHCTSQGKAILSAMPTEAREAFVREAVLKPLTPMTITDRRRFNAELRITRARGYAIDDEEIVLGVRCVGAPVIDGADRVHGAISVAGPAYRLTRERLELLGPEVAEAARRIGAQLSVAGEMPAGLEQTIHAVPGPWAFRGAYPLWSVDARRLWWADVLAPSVRLYENGEDREVVVVDSPILGLLREGDGVVAVHERGITRISAGGAAASVSTGTESRIQAVCNGHDGAIWGATSSPEGGASIGLLRCDGLLDTRWRVGEAVQGLAWNAQEQTLYAALPGSGSIIMLRPEQAAVRRLASLPRGSGRISGLAFDGQGGLWTALCDGWAVVRMHADGQMDRVVGLPVPCPTDLDFISTGNGASTGKLAISTDRHGVAIDTLNSAPLSGRMLLLDL